MDKKEIFLTPEGAEKIRKELDELRGPRREELSKRLRHAVQQGDLTENADYIVAKEEQAFLEGRIQELETILKEATVVDNDGSSDEIGIGNTVVVAESDRPPETFHIVGLKEADPRNGKISHESPIGRALMGKRLGEQVAVETPGGTVRFTILEIR